MRFQIDPNKKAKQWLADFNSVSTVEHFEKLERAFCQSLFEACYHETKINQAKVKQANDKYNAVCLQLNRTDGLVLKKDAFLEFLKKDTQSGRVAACIEANREHDNFMADNVFRKRI